MITMILYRELLNGFINVSEHFYSNVKFTHCLPVDENI